MTKIVQSSGAPPSHAVLRADRLVVGPVLLLAGRLMAIVCLPPRQLSGFGKEK
jgi:hypothetical protein